MPSYLGYEIWEPSFFFNWASGPTSEFVMVGEAWQHQIKERLEPIEQRIESTIVLSDRAARQELRDYFDSKRGRYTPFWLAGRRKVFALNAAAVASATSLSVEDKDGIFGLFDVNRHIYIRSLAQSLQIISNERLTGPARVELEVDPGISAALPSGEPIEFLYFVRFASDELTITSSRLGPEVSEARLTFVELQRETPDA